MCLSRRFLTSIAACSRACWMMSSLWIARPQLAQVVPVTLSTSLIFVPQCTVRSWLQPGHLNGTLLIIVDLLPEDISWLTVATTASMPQDSSCTGHEVTSMRGSGRIADEKNRVVRRGLKPVKKPDEINLLTNWCNCQDFCHMALQYLIAKSTLSSVDTALFVFIFVAICNPKYGIRRSRIVRRQR